MIIIGNGRVITRGTPNLLLENGAVAFEGAFIRQVGDTTGLCAQYSEARFIDARGGIIMPGLINAHNHIYSTFARGLSVNGYAPKSFPEILDGLWWTLDRNLFLEDTYYSAMDTYIDCIKNGCTTVFDHHASYGEIPGSLSKIAQAAGQLGVRTSLCYEVSDRDGDSKMCEAVHENAEFIKYVRAKGTSAVERANMLHAMMGMHASFTLSDKTLQLCRDNTPDDVGFHIHVAEGTEDEDDCVAKYGKRVAERLRDFGILGKNTILGHCIHINDVEMEIIRETETTVVHNPESNMGNAVGIPPCMEMIRRGIAVGLGTDGYSNDMFESASVANIIHKHVLGDPGAAWNEVPQMLYTNNADIATRAFGVKLGVLEAGAAADIIVSDYIPTTPMNQDNCNSHILFGMKGRSVVTTVINGEVLMENRVLIGIDEEEMLEKSRESAAGVWRRING